MNIFITYLLYFTIFKIKIFKFSLQLMKIKVYANGEMSN